MTVLALPPRRLARRLVSLAAVFVTACTGVVGSTDSTTPSEPAGSVTFAELEAAAARTVECMEDKGLRGVIATYDPSNFGFGFEWSDVSSSAAGPENSAAVDLAGFAAQEAIVTQCAEEHLDTAAAAWQAMHSAEIEAANRAFEQRIIRCLREQGIEVAELNPATVDEIDAAHPGVRDQCFNRALDEEALEREQFGSTTTVPDASR